MDWFVMLIHIRMFILRGQWLNFLLFFLLISSYAPFRTRLVQNAMSRWVESTTGEPRRPWCVLVSGIIVYTSLPLWMIPVNMIVYKRVFCCCFFCWLYRSDRSVKFWESKVLGKWTETDGRGELTRVEGGNKKYYTWREREYLKLQTHPYRVQSTLCIAPMTRCCMYYKGVTVDLVPHPC